MRRVCVAGAGPAGLAAAVFAARAGADVILVEKNDRCGVKLLTTGGGHCNVTNSRPAADWPQLFGRRGRFIVPALEFMPRPRLESWFESLGQPLHCPDGRHVFPTSNSARAVRDALLDEARRANVRILHNKRASAIRLENGGATGIVCEDGTTVDGRVVLACGGKSYPATGSTWDGAAIAAATGHGVNPPWPGLVGLRADNLNPDLAGLVLRDAGVSFRVKGAAATNGRGELLLTHGGVSGPAILDLSGCASEALAATDSLALKISWLADTNAAAWRGRLDDWRRDRGATPPAALLKEFLPQRLARWLCERSGVEDGVATARLTSANLENLSANLGGFPAWITASEGWDKAMVTRGGVEVREVNPDTLESKLAPGLFFAGEMLDVDGPCGGYNLHWAFASGALAGTRAAHS